MTPVEVLELNWHQNAYLDLAWEQEILAGALTQEQAQGVQREYFRDPFAGFGVWVYPDARTLILDANRPYNPIDPLDTMMDPAGTGDDFAFFAAQAHADDGNEGFHILFGYQRQQPNPLRIAHLHTGIWPAYGDACYGWIPDTEEEELGRFYYDAWINNRELRFFMDPAADQIHSGSSFWMQYRDLTKTLRQREYEHLAAINIALEELGKPTPALPVPKPIVPLFNYLKDKRLFGDREYAFRRYLPFVTVQIGVPSAARVRECAGRTRYNDLSDKAVTEPKRRHDQYSHHASNLENYSLYYNARFVDPMNTKAFRKQMRGLGLPGVPDALNRNISLPGGARVKLPNAALMGDPRPGPPDRVSQGGWNR